MILHEDQKIFTALTSLVISFVVGFALGHTLTGVQWRRALAATRCHQWPPLNMHFIARRAMVAAAAAAGLMSPTALPAIAVQPSTVVASGMVQLQNGAAAVGADAPGAALYVRESVSTMQALSLLSPH